jgi:hypothetical protein
VLNTQQISGTGRALHTLRSPRLRSNIIFSFIIYTAVLPFGATQRKIIGELGYITELISKNNGGVGVIYLGRASWLTN